MKLAKIILADKTPAVARIDGQSASLISLDPPSGVTTLTDILHSDDPPALVRQLAEKCPRIPLSDVRVLAPIDQQEVWAAGVTYKRSQVARMEESEAGASHYDQVYTADRPELFFKATPHRVVHPGEPVRVRADSKWSVPEPEFTLVLNPQMRIVGYTVGNDMSARDIEGENPLYLPQAKLYRQCCALGPVVLLAEEPLSLAETQVTLTISRGGHSVFHGETDLSQLHRKLPDLATWLGKENDFPHGAFLLTGTGIVPDDDFTLEDGDEVAIHITGIGTLTNPVVQEKL